jgi:hypothetical protein
MDRHPPTRDADATGEREPGGMPPASVVRSEDPPAYGAASAAPATRGALYICTGERYVQEASRSAASLRASSPGLATALFTDLQRGSGRGIDWSVFDQVLPIRDPHRRSKVDCLPETPFDLTLYLDSDTRVCADLGDVFAVLERFDVALTHAASRYRRLTNETWRLALPNTFPQFNGGVIAYRRTPAVLDFLHAWSSEYRSAGFKKDQVSLRELLWSSKLRIATLPPEYNLRSLKYLWVWRLREAQPKILHLQRYHRYGWWDRRVDQLVTLALRVRGAARAAYR